MERFWSNRGEDDGSIHPIGNGQLLVYGQGPNIIHMFGPPYSAPSFLRMDIYEQNRNVKAVSKREGNTAVWRHEISCDGGDSAELIDYIMPKKAVFFRDITLGGSLNFKIIPVPNVKVCILKNYFEHIRDDSFTILLTITKGSLFFTNDTVIQEINMIITVIGNASVSNLPDGSIVFVFKTGSHKLIFSSGSLPSAVEQVEIAMRSSGQENLEKSRSFWNEFSSGRRDFGSMIPLNVSQRDRILEAIDSVSILIKCQQSNSGGIAAGHYYNMAYVRDQSGVLRGLLALGYTAEAKAILTFWKNKWDLFGNLYNAEGMGNNNARLFFTNDEVEIPAYVILSCFSYHNHTHDDEFLNKLFPMMEWAFEVQLGHLAEGMTEFSGDETYIAGKTFPRHFIYHGSAESTMLFISSGEKLLDWAERNNLWPESKICRYKQKVNFARQKYKINFMMDGILFANNSLRETVAGRPRYRFSFCEAHEILQKVSVITWNEVDGMGYYNCPDCRGTVLPEVPNEKKRYVLNSVSLMPVYMGSGLLSQEEVEKITRPIAETFREKEIVPSNTEESRSLGYDYGLMLYNMVKLNNPLKDKVLQKMLDLLDPTGAWVEYYDGDKPFNCRARPWESAINIEAVIEYIKARFN